MAETLLQGIVGSTAYGLAGPDSDVDQLGIFVRPTIELVGLVVPEDSIVRTNPDVTLHEAGKFVRLALKCNPTILELMWLTPPLYTVQTELGQQLCEIRYAFLSKSYVRNAYFGYATEQFHRLSRTGAFASTHRARTAKHARHVYRLLYQGYKLYAAGRLDIGLEDPERFKAFGERAAEDPQQVVDVLAYYKRKFDNCNSSLPDYPDVAQAIDWLLSVRKAHW